MSIGIASGIPFNEFTAALATVALAGLGIAWIVLVLVYRSEFYASRFERAPELQPTLYRPLLWKGVLASGLMLLAFILGLPIPLAALSAAAMLLITRRLKPQRVFREMDWGLLVFFSGLFIVTGAIETAGLSQKLFAVLLPVAEQGVAALSGVAVVLSNLVSNVPAVLLFRPLVANFPDPQRTWLTLAMATTLAGNLTLLGSVANLIVAETARNRGVKLSFVEYLKAGVPITVGTLILGILWMSR